MPSPFPGMDPWLESTGLFPDLHSTLITYLGDALNAVLPEPYFARSSTRVWLEEGQQREPDVSLLDDAPHAERPVWGGMTAALAAVGMIGVEAGVATSDPHEETVLEIRSTAGERLVTAVEILSPSNKEAGSRGRESYRDKQAEYLREGIGLVEIDLLRGGQHTTAVSLSGLRRAAGFTPYHVCVTAHFLTPPHFVAPIRLEHPLPAITIPLDRDVPPARVELQPLLDRAYDNRRYARQLRYTRVPDPPLTQDQRLWADGILKAKGLIA